MNLRALVAFDRVYYVGISVNGSEELKPRTMLTAVPYALRSESAAMADVARTLAPEALKGVTVQTTPSGPAGGDLSGTYPNPSIGASKVTTTKIAYAAVTTEKIAPGAVTDAKISSVSWSKISGAPTSFPPSGAAGGDLSGTYPNPTIANDAVTSAKIADGTIVDADIATGAGIAVSKLAPGSNGQVLSIVGGVPQWNDANALFWRLAGNSGTNSVTHFLGTTDGQPIVFRTNNTERVRIDANGNVGIGTSVPSVPLEVVGSVRLATSAGTSVVIGNVSADGKLRVDGTIRAEGYRTADGTSGVPSYRFVNSASTGMFSPSANQLALATNGSERMRIDAGGNVGIGTTSPSARLDVAGSLRVTGNLDVTGTKNFCIPHPLEPERKVLRHAAIESNEVLNQYSGNVILDDAGQAWVELPSWFEAINCDYRYQLTCIGTFAPVYIAEECRGNKFKIAGGKPGMKVSWQVTAVRNDAFIRSNPFRAEEHTPVGSAIGGNDVR